MAYRLLDARDLTLTMTQATGGMANVIHSRKSTNPKHEMRTFKLTSRQSRTKLRG